MSAKMKAANEWIHANMHMPVNELIKKLNTKLIGHYRYYGITGNYDKLEMFRWYVIERLKAWLHRRSQRAKMTSQYGHYFVCGVCAVRLYSVHLSDK